MHVLPVRTIDIIFWNAGTDRNLAYWNAFLGEAIRELEGSAAMLSLAMRPGRHVFAAGDADSQMQLWH